MIKPSDQHRSGLSLDFSLWKIIDFIPNNSNMYCKPLIPKLFFLGSYILKVTNPSQ